MSSFLPLLHSASASEKGGRAGRRGAALAVGGGCSDSRQLLEGRARVRVHARAALQRVRKSVVCCAASPGPPTLCVGLYVCLYCGPFPRGHAVAMPNGCSRSHVSMLWPCLTSVSLSREYAVAMPNVCSRYHVAMLWPCLTSVSLSREHAVAMPSICSRYHVGMLWPCLTSVLVITWVCCGRA